MQSRRGAWCRHQRFKQSTRAADEPEELRKQAQLTRYVDEKDNGPGRRIRRAEISKGMLRSLMDYPAKKRESDQTQGAGEEIGQLGRGREEGVYANIRQTLHCRRELISASINFQVEGESLESHVNVLSRANVGHAFATLVGVSFNDHATSTVTEWCKAYRDHFKMDASVFLCCCTDHWLLAWFGDGEVHAPQ